MQAEEEFAGFRGGEAEVRSGDFQQLAMRAETPEANVRGAPRADQQLAVGRQVAGDLAHQVEHGRVADRLEVIEEQGEWRGQRQQPIGQVDRRAFDGIVVVERRGEVGSDFLQRGDQMVDEATDIVVGVVQCQPGDLPAILPQQFVGLAHDGRFAEAGRTLDHHQARVSAGADAFDDLLARQRCTGAERRSEFRAPYPRWRGDAARLFLSVVSTRHWHGPGCWNIHYPDAGRACIPSSWGSAQAWQCACRGVRYARHSDVTGCGRGGRRLPAARCR
ncbi:hypothetical protein D3C76_524390 [compost metagenome]